MIYLFEMPLGDSMGNNLDTPPPLGEGALNGVRKKPGFSGINESGACSKNPPGYRFIISIQGVFRGFLGGF